jgi:hypothetical protein
MIFKTIKRVCGQCVAGEVMKGGDLRVGMDLWLGFPRRRGQKEI